MKQYKVFFTHTFNKMFKYHLRKYSAYSTTYALKIEKELVEFIRFLKTFPYATPVVKFIGNNQNYRKHVIKKKISNHI